MKKIFGVAAMLAVLGTGAATSALAQCSAPPALGPMIKFDADAFAYETAYNPATFVSSPGSQLSIVGIVSGFCAPLAGLDPSDPGKEYTFYVTGLTSAGTAGPIPVGPTTFWTCNYSGGTWAIYEGTPRNAPTAAGGMPALPNASVPANFTDGTVILSGTLSGFSTTISKTGASPANGSFRADYVPTGGSYYSQVGNAPAIFQGNWCVTLAPTGCTPATYSAHPNGKWDQPPSVPTLAPTWGKIKQLYR